MKKELKHISDIDFVLRSCIQDLTFPSEEKKIYVAFAGKRCEGLAIRDSNEISLLCSNPCNTPLHGISETQVRGAGRALVTHICQDVRAEMDDAKIKGDAKIKVISVPTAREFYKKLGFEPSDDASDCRRLYLKPTTADSLIQQQKSVQAITTLATATLDKNLLQLEPF